MTARIVPVSRLALIIGWSSVAAHATALAGILTLILTRGASS